MPTMVFSNESRYWRPLCAGPLYPESSVPGPGNCEICITPETVTPTGTGTGTGPTPGTGTNPSPGTGNVGGP